MISAVIILELEQNGFAEYVKTIDRILAKCGSTHEILIIANGTGNFIRSCLPGMQELHDRLRVFEFRLRCSKADCMRAITKETQGDWLLISGSQQELSEESIRKLISKAKTPADVIIPWRRKRRARLTNQIYSRIFNWMVDRLTKNDFHDISCSVKLCRSAILEDLTLFGDVLLFLPIFAATKGYKIIEIPVEGSLIEPRGRFFFSPKEFLTRVIEVFALFFHTRFSSMPLRFFSAVGALFSFAGLIMLFVLFIQRFFFGILIGNRPSLFIALLLMILGFLVSSAGLLGEIIVYFNRRSRKGYTVEKIVS